MNPRRPGNRVSPGYGQVVMETLHVRRAERHDIGKSVLSWQHSRASPKSHVVSGQKKKKTLCNCVFIIDVHLVNVIPSLCIIQSVLRCIKWTFFLIWNPIFTPVFFSVYNSWMLLACCRIIHYAHSSWLIRNQHEHLQHTRTTCFSQIREIN